VIRQSEVTAIDTVLCVTPEATSRDKLVGVGLCLALAGRVTVESDLDRQTASDAKDNTKEDGRERGGD